MFTDCSSDDDTSDSDIFYIYMFTDCSSDDDTSDSDIFALEPTEESPNTPDDLQPTSPVIISSASVLVSINVIMFNPKNS